jgi:Flp pilus assembly pilin Flp
MRRLKLDWMKTTGAACARLVADEGGQDLIEYGLLTGIIASGTIALLLGMTTTLQTAFSTWEAGRNNLSTPVAPPIP